MVYEADTLKEILRTSWTLTGLLSAEGTAAANNVLRPIKFFAREQLDEKIESKAIEVIKQTPLPIDENNEFFTEETDEFLIKITKKLGNVSKDDWDQAEADLEDIETEVERILKATYNPQTGVGVWFSTSFNWKNIDSINHPKEDAYLIRTLTLTLTRIVSKSTDVFDSFKRGVFIDLSGSSNMDSAPGADYDYTEVYNIEKSEGFRDVELDVTSNPDGVGVPLFYAGRFSGTLVMHSKMRDNDIGSSADKINSIYMRQTNGEKIEAAIVRTYTNNASQTLTITTVVRVQEVRIVEPQTNLLEWQILAKVIKPSTMVIS